MIDRNDRNGRSIQAEAEGNRQERPAADYGLLDGHIIYVGALSCMRHRGQEFTQLQREGRLSYLILNEIDYITGDYLEKIKEAAREIASEEHPSALNLAVGCQGALLSTDYRMLAGELEKELSIPVRIDENCHLLGYDHHGRHGGRGDHGGRHGSRGDHDRDHGGRHGSYGVHDGDYGSRHGSYEAHNGNHGGRHDSYEAHDGERDGRYGSREDHGGQEETIKGRFLDFAGLRKDKNKSRQEGDTGR